jgi:glutaredoxin-related protein
MISNRISEQTDKDKVYEIIKQKLLDRKPSPEALREDLEEFRSWWKNVFDVTIGQNTIDVEFYGGGDIQKACHAMYRLAYYTKKVITTSFNNTKIIMVDQDG